jgi:predicted AAA+ superfamily ATPase
VGKTTLIEALPKRRYLTLDDRATRLKFESDLEGVLNTSIRESLSIDECHLYPPLFAGIKESVRKHKRPGLFLLTGSVRFQSKTDIRESLTGRILLHRLHPMTLSETCERIYDSALEVSLNGAWDKLESLIEKKSDLESKLSRFSQTGGLPGICFTREARVRGQQHESVIETMLERDLRLIEPTTLPYESLRNVLSALARLVHAEFEFRQLSSMSRVSTPALRKLIRALESLYLINLLEPEGGAGRLRVYFEDTGEWRHLLGSEPDWVSSAVQMLFHQARVTASLSQETYLPFSYYKTRGGAEVPLVVKTKSKQLAIFAIPGSVPSPQVLGSLKSFRSHYPKSNAIFVSQNSAFKIWDKNSAIVPLYGLL